MLGTEAGTFLHYYLHWRGGEARGTAIPNHSGS